MQKRSQDTQNFFSTPRGLVLLSLGVAVVLVLEARAFLVVPTPSGAYPVLSTAAWAKQASPMAYPMPYHWLANGDLAFLRKNKDALYQVCYQQMDAKGPVGNLREGPELPSTAQAEAFNPSPDEKWVAVRQPEPRNRSYTVLVSADGKTTPLAGTVGETFSKWLSDSRSFLLFCHQPQMSLKIRHLDSPNTETITGSTPIEMPESMFEFADGPDFQIGNFYNLGQSNPGLLSNGATMTMRTFYVSKPGVVQQTTQVAIPPGCEYAGAYVSPDRKHLLWFTSSVKRASGSSWIGRIMGAQPTNPTFEEHFFLSDLSGNNRRPFLDDAIQRYGSISPVWTPDGKHVSFLFNDHLYLVPIE